MVQRFGITLTLGCFLTAAPSLFAQQQTQDQQSNPNSQGQGQQDKKGNPFPTDTGNVPVMPSNGAPPAQQPSPAQQPQQDQQKSNGQPPQQKGNPFPTDTGNVPVMPSNSAPDVPSGNPSDEGAHFSLPSGDSDPVASPDGADSESSSEGVSSSDVRGLDSILPPPGGDEPTGKRGRKRNDEIEGPPKESSKEDISVGQYYLDNKNWKAALSRFQSALVLAPEEPEVYWGLAESERHLGDYASAKANYQKVIEYDPDSKHAKEAKKALKDPEIANAKPPATGQTPP